MKRLLVLAAAAGLSLNGNCVAREETGYAENVRVTVAAGQVRALEQRLRGAHVAAGRPHHGGGDRLRGEVHARGVRIRLAGPVQRRRGLLLTGMKPLG